MKRLAAAAGALILLAAMAILSRPSHARSGSRRGAITAGLLALLLATPVLALTETPPAPSASPSAEDAWHLANVEDPAPLGLREIVAWDHGFAALGWPRNAAMDDQGRTVPVWLSEDGATWRRSEQPIRLPSRTAIAMELAALDGDLLAFGSDGRRLLVWRSDDGQRWRRLSDRPALDGKGIPRDLPYLGVMGAATANGRVVVSGQYGAPGDTAPIGRVWSSRDGRSWRFTTPDTPGGWPIYGLEAGPDGFLGMALDARGCHDVGGASVRSGDGLDWERATRARRVCGLQAVVYDEHTDAFYATTFENQHGAVLRSEDRRSWEEVHELSTELDGRSLTLVPYALHAADGVIAVLGEGSTIDAEDNTIDHAFAAVSADGEDWHTTVDWPATSADHRASALGHDRLVVATGSGLWYVDLADLGVEVTAPIPGSDARPASVAGTWRKLPESPFGAALGDGVWAGDQMIVSAYGTKRIAGYGPRDKTWTRYPNAPYELYGGSLTWTGTESPGPNRRDRLRRRAAGAARARSGPADLARAGTAVRGGSAPRLGRGPAHRCVRHGDRPLRRGGRRVDPTAGSAARCRWGHRPRLDR